MKKVIDDIKSAKWAIIAIIAYFALFRKIFYTICPFVLVTGFPCPGCGMTRAAVCLMHLDFLGAWKMHPFIYLIAILAVWFCISRYLLNGKTMKALKVAIVFVAVGMIILYIWRMKVNYPDIPPMVYYENNLLSRLKSIFALLF